jgi:putative ABC transport system permease protein
VTGVIVAAVLVVAAVGLSGATRMGLERELVLAAVRAAAQLTVVGAIIALVFEHAGLAWAFVAVMPPAPPRRSRWAPPRRSSRCSRPAPSTPGRAS